MRLIGLNCGAISPKYFRINLPMFSESQKHNTCLHRKISIDSKGDIRNCPSMPESFGNIRDTKLREAIRQKSFKKYWDITKDKITVCSDCEFRHICTDCRAYGREENDIYSKPLKCGYDPYSLQWDRKKPNTIKPR